MSPFLGIRQTPKGDKVAKDEDGSLQAAEKVKRVVMARHNLKWMQSMLKNKMTIEFNGFYMDVGQIVMFSLRPG